MTSPDTAFNKARSDEGLIVHLMHPGPEVARRSRQVVGGVLADRPDGFRQVAELLTSELVTNALLHTRSSVWLRVRIAEERLAVEVADLNRAANVAPVPRELQDEHGRGLVIVEALASRWGVQRSAVTKTVWFELDF